MTIDRFAGKYLWLSNFYMRAVTYNEVRFASNEHGFQANKFTHLPAVFDLVRRSTRPADAKNVARRYKSHILPEWYAGRRIDVMRGLLWQKYSVPYLADLLVETYPHELIEGNTWGDVYWGQCPIGNGENMHGILSMEVRYQIMLGRSNGISS